MFCDLADAVSGRNLLLLELMFRKMSSTLSRCDKSNNSEFAKAFEVGVEAVSLYGSATFGARTMLTLWFLPRPPYFASGSMNEAAQKAKEGADATASMMRASAGRSNYLPY